jgi:hypothetical protein
LTHIPTTSALLVIGAWRTPLVHAVSPDGANAFRVAEIRQLTSVNGVAQANAREKAVGGRSIGFLYAVNDFRGQQLSYVSALIYVDKYYPSR